MIKRGHIGIYLVVHGAKPNAKVQDLLEKRVASKKNTNTVETTLIETLTRELIRHHTWLISCWLLIVYILCFQC